MITTTIKSSPWCIEKSNDESTWSWLPNSLASKYAIQNSALSTVTQNSLLNSHRRQRPKP